MGRLSFGERQFSRLTEQLLAVKRTTGFCIQAPAQFVDPAEYRAFSTAFGGKTEPKAVNRDMPWADWLVEGVFPLTLYHMNKQDLRKLIADPRCWEKIPKMSGYNSWNSSWGRMCKPREGIPGGLMLYMLDRWKGKYRGMPQYYFDAELPEWVVEPLVGRPDVPKTNRTSVSCTMNYAFHWLDGKAHMSAILRHMNWSHAWGNVYGSALALQAICKELGSIPLGNVTIFANSATMDAPKEAKLYLKELYK